MIVEDLMLNASYFISPAGDSDGRNQFERKIDALKHFPSSFVE